MDAEAEFSRAVRGLPMQRAELHGLNGNTGGRAGAVGAIENADVPTHEFDDPEPLASEDEKRGAQWVPRFTEPLIYNDLQERATGLEPARSSWKVTGLRSNALLQNGTPTSYVQHTTAAERSIRTRKRTWWTHGGPKR